MAITQFPNGSNEFSWVVGVNCPNFILVWQEMVESIHAWFTWFGLARIDMSELRVDVLHHHCHRFTFDVFFHISFNNSVVSDNVIPRTFGFQSLLPSLLLCGWRHHARLLADFAERVFGIMAKLMSFAAGFDRMYSVSLSWAAPSSIPSSSASTALAETIAKSRSKSQSFLNCLLFRTRHGLSMTGTRQSTFSSMTPMSGRMKYGLPSAGQTKLCPCSMHRNPTDNTAGASSRMCGENGWCRSSTFTSATSSARVEPFAVAKLIGVLLTRWFVAFAVFSIPSLIRSCSLPVSTNHTHPSLEAGVATVGKWVSLTLFFGPSDRSKLCSGYMMLRLCCYKKSVSIYKKSEKLMKLQYLDEWKFGKIKITKLSEKENNIMKKTS